MMRAKMPDNVSGFFLLRSYSGKQERLAFRCERCNLEVLFARGLKSGAVKHCDRTEHFRGKWWERLSLPRRRLQMTDSPITLLGDAVGEVTYECTR